MKTVTIYATLRAIPAWNILVILVTKLLLPCGANPKMVGHSPLQKCLKFADYRQQDHGTTSVYIPENRTSDGIYVPRINVYNRFVLTPGNHFACPSTHTKERVLFWNYPSPNRLAPRDFNSVEGGARDPPSLSYFTRGGYFYDSETRIFYKPNGEYCISSISDEKLTLNLCAIYNDCEKAAHPQTYCLPKCCAVDEVLSLPSKTCIPAGDLRFSSNKHYHGLQGVTPWFPQVYSGNKNYDKPLPWTVKVEQNWLPSQASPNHVISKVTFQMASLPKTCNAVPLGNSVAHFKLWLHVQADSHHDFSVPSRDMARLGIPDGGRNGKILPMLYNRAKGLWKKQKGLEFCAEGFFMEEEGVHSYDENHNYVIIYCEHEGRRGSSGKCLISWVTSLLLVSIVVFSCIPGFKLMH